MVETRANVERFHEACLRRRALFPLLLFSPLHFVRTMQKQSEREGGQVTRFKFESQFPRLTSYKKRRRHLYIFIIHV